MVFRKPGPEITRRCEAHYFHHSFEAISNKVLTVFQFRVVAPTDSAFSKRRFGELGVAIPTRAVKVDFLSANAKPIWFR
jgi:hypothetical protein